MYLAGKAYRIEFYVIGLEETRADAMETVVF